MARRVTKHNPLEDQGQDLVRLYLDDIGRYPLLTKADEVRLAQRIEAGRAAAEALTATPKPTPAKKRELTRTARDGEAAHREFVNTNLRLVVSIAKKYQASGLPLLDLVQEGNLGLIHAVDKFDWRRGFKFSTYATWWIRQAIQRGIANSARTIRVPSHAVDQIARVRKVRNELESTLARPATQAELAEALDITEDQLVEIQRFAAEPRSLSEVLSDDGDAELGDIVADRSARSPFDVVADSMLGDEVAKLLASLDERERHILELRFGLDRGEPRTLAEIGDHLSIPHDRVRQIEVRALSKLRHPSVKGDEMHELLAS